MDGINERPMNPFQQLDFPSFDQSTTNNPDDSIFEMEQLSLSLRNKLNSLRSIRKNFSRPFGNILLSSEKKDNAQDSVNYEQRYTDLKSKYGELEELNQKHIEETLQTLNETREGYEKKIKSLNDELNHKEASLGSLKQDNIQAQEKINLIETRLASLEQLNTTLTAQLKEKAKELSGSIEGVGNNVITKTKDLVSMKTDFLRLVEKVDTFEDTIKNLKEGRKQDNKLLEEEKQKNEELKTENFQMLMENKKLKNDIEEISSKLSSMDRCILERKEKTDEFIETLARYQNSFQVINEVHLDLEKIFEPLKEQNRRLLEEKEKLLEENAHLKVKMSSLEEEKQRKMEVEEERSEQINGQGKSNKEDHYNSIKGIDQKFYMDIMEKFKEFEKLIQEKDKENQNLQNEYDELKSRNLELETKIISMNRSPQKKEINYGQFLTVESESHGGIMSPHWRKGILQNSQSNSEIKRKSEKEDETKDENSNRENTETMEEETDSRLKIQKKPKQVKKNTAALNFLTGITICPNCSLIVKKSDKSVKECIKCQVSIHEKCAEEQKGKDVFCNPCHEKKKKQSGEQTEHNEEEEDNKNQTLSENGH